MMNALPTATNGFKEEQILLAVSGERQRIVLICVANNQSRGGLTGQAP